MNGANCQFNDQTIYCITIEPSSQTVYATYVRTVGAEALLYILTPDFGHEHRHDKYVLLSEITVLGTMPMLPVEQTHDADPEGDSLGPDGTDGT